MEIKPVRCKICGDNLSGHEEDGFDVCRWCNEGWIPSEDGSSLTASTLNAKDITS